MRVEKMLSEIAVSPLSFEDKKVVMEAYEVIYESTISNTLLLIGMLSSILYSKQPKDEAVYNAAKSVYSILEKTYNTGEQAKADSTVLSILNDMDKKYGKGTSVDIMEKASAILDVKKEKSTSSTSSSSSSSKASDFQPSLEQAKLSVQGKSGERNLYIGLYDGKEIVKVFTGKNALNQAKAFNKDNKYKIMYKIEIPNAVNIGDSEHETQAK